MTQIKNRMSKAQFSCPLLAGEELERVTVPFAALAAGEEEGQRGLREVLQEHGMAVVSGVITEEELCQLEADMQADLAELVDEEQIEQVGNAQLSECWRLAREGGVGAWPSSALKTLGIKNRLQLRGLPHGRFSWKCRLHANVKKVYAVLHECEESDLVSSCDNAFVAPLSAPAASTNDLWPHVDQNDCDMAPVRVAGAASGASATGASSAAGDTGKQRVADWDVYQGVLYVWSSEDERSSTTVTWPGSHHKHGVYGTYMKDKNLQKRGRRPAHAGHFTAISMMQKGRGERDEMMRGWREHSRRIPVPRGGLLLWASRTTHQGWSGGPRLAQPVCWEPVVRRTDESRHRKMAMAALGLPSTHWASLGLPHHLVTPETPKSSPATAPGTGNGDVVFAMNPMVRPYGLADGVDPLDLWREFSEHDWQKPMAPRLVELLEKSLTDEMKAAL